MTSLETSPSAGASPEEKSVDEPSVSAPDPVSSERIFNAKEDLTEQDRKGIIGELREFRDKDDWMNIARNLAHLRRAGVRINKEKWGEVAGELQAKTEKYRSDPRKLALYLSYGRCLGMIKEEHVSEDDKEILDNYYKKQIKLAPPERDKNFSRFCASLRLLDKKKDLDGATRAIRHEMTLSVADKDEKGRFQKEDLAKGQTTLVMARAKFIYGADRLGTQEKAAKYMQKELKAASEAKEWNIFARTRNLYEYVTDKEYGLSDEQKTSMKVMVNSLRGTWNNFNSYIGRLVGRGKSVAEVTADLVSGPEEGTSTEVDPAGISEPESSGITKADEPDHSKKAQFNADELAEEIIDFDNEEKIENPAEGVQHPDSFDLDPDTHSEEMRRLNAQNPALLKRYFETREQLDSINRKENIDEYLRLTRERQAIVTEVIRSGFKLDGGDLENFYQAETQKLVGSA